MRAHFGFDRGSAYVCAQGVRRRKGLSESQFDAVCALLQDGSSEQGREYTVGIERKVYAVEHREELEAGDLLPELEKVFMEVTGQVLLLLLLLLLLPPRGPGGPFFDARTQKSLTFNQKIHFLQESHWLYTHLHFL